MIRINMEKPVSCKECPLCSKEEIDHEKYIFKKYCLPLLCKPINGDTDTTRAEFCPICDDKPKGERMLDFETIKVLFKKAIDESDNMSATFEKWLQYIYEQGKKDA